MSRSLIISALMPLVLASPARAEVTIDTAAAGLQGATGEALLKAAYATCLGLGNVGNAAAEAFQVAGWDVETDYDSGSSDIAGPEDIYVLTWTDGGYCLVQSESIGSERAAVLLAEVIAESGAAAAQEAGPDGCLAFGLAGDNPRAEIASSGNDPVCSSPDTSGVSFMWAQGEEDLQSDD